MLKNNVTQRPLSELQSIVDSTEYDLPENMKMSRKTNIKPQHAYKAFDLQKVQTRCTESWAPPGSDHNVVFAMSVGWFIAVVGKPSIAAYAFRYSVWPRQAYQPPLLTHKHFANKFKTSSRQKVTNCQCFFKWLKGFIRLQFNIHSPKQIYASNPSIFSLDQSPKFQKIFCLCLIIS